MDGQRLANIDALRGLAALLVVWLHAAAAFVNVPSVAAQGKGLADFASFWEIGVVGVTAFFAISGFVVTPTIRPPRLTGIRDFAIKRFFRLFPPYWFALALTYLCIWWPLGWTPTWAGVLANTSMLTTLWGQRSAMGHFWTLEVELLFYALIVVLFACGLLQRRGVKLALVVLLFSKGATVLAWRAVSDLEVQFFWGLVPFSLATMFWASLLRDRYDPAASSWETLRRWAKDPIVVVATVLVVGRVLWPGKLWNAGLEQYLQNRGELWGLLLFLLFATARLRWPRAIVWTGTVSYSVYLLHPVVFYPLYFYLERNQNWFTALPVAVYVVLVTVAIIALSSVVYRLLEQPCNEFARRLIQRLGPGTPPLRP